MNNMLPDWLHKFPFVGDLQERTTRQSNHLAMKRTNTDLGKRAISVRGPKEWNDIPVNIRNSTSIKVFKKSLKKHILSSSF